MRKIFFALLILLTTVANAFATDNNEGQLSDSARLDENFVIASVLITTYDDVLYSQYGHASLRLQCPQHGLDFIFSMESEDVADKVLMFFAGKLKQHVFAIPTKEHLDKYAKSGRGVTEYILRLPIEVKQKLWQQMDERIALPYTPYDFVNGSCAVVVLEWLNEAVGPDNVDYGVWEEKWQRNRKEIASDSVKGNWTRAMGMAMFDGELRDDVSYLKKVIVPAELVEVLQRTRAFGKPLIAGKGICIAQQKGEFEQCPVTPVMTAIALLLIAMLNLKFRNLLVASVLLALSVLLGSALTYLVLLSDLCCTQFNWMIVPFNMLPLLLWKWRNYVFPLQACVSIIWALCMIPFVGNIVGPEGVIAAAASAFGMLGMLDENFLKKSFRFL